MEIPGYKVFRWERLWDIPGKPFKDPLDYPAASVATSGTHDTEPMAVWWEQATQEERQAALDVPSVRSRLSETVRAQALETPLLSHTVRTAILEVLFASGSNLLILPLQDVFGWTDRINQPATVGDQNWTWRLPWPVDRMAAAPAAITAQRHLCAWSTTYGR
jgi:4-alpha-glucanotransferase